MKVLAIETSCDETACAVVVDGIKILSNVVASSKSLHNKYGGIVPEVAAREQLKYMIPVLRETLEQALNKTTNSISHPASPALSLITSYIDAIAVTVGPGLIGSLLVGVETAKTLAFTTGKPLIPVNHVLAHAYANFVRTEQNSSEPRAQNPELITFPAVSLVVSGGHTELYLMKSVRDLKWLGGTLDDAAGEAFDKTARLLGFGHGGGPAVQEAASKLRAQSPEPRAKLPRPMLKDESFNFSFSGLKTAVLREWNKYQEYPEELIAAFAHEIQEAITDVLVEKTLRAAQKFNAKSILVSGGVAANTRLREKFNLSLIAYRLSLPLFVPPIHLCTDNAVYVASYAFFRGKPTAWKNVTPAPDLSVEV